MRAIVAVILCLFTVPAFAANHYIRAGAGGSATGADWTNAYTVLPAALTRGDTYYIADGTYAAYTFDDSGTSTIYIKKAVASDHGTETGWSSTYGDGEALFSSSGVPWTFTSGYYNIDGQTGSGKSPGGYGIRVYSTASRATSAHLVSANGVSNITVRHVEFDFNNGTSGSGGNATELWNSTGSSAVSGITIQYCYFHHSSGFAFYLGEYGTPSNTHSTYIIEHNYFYMMGGGGGASAHWELMWLLWANDFTFRYNTVENVFGSVDAMTGWLMVGGSTNVKYYGNLLFCSNPSYCSFGGNGTIATWSADSYANNGVYIYNNTFADLAGGYGPQIYFTHNSADDTNVVVRNNLYYNADFSWTGVDTHSHEACGGGQPCDGTNTQAITTGIFTNYASDVFTLASATTAGTTLASPYNADMLGSTRGADGTWDRGAYEYAVVGPPAPVLTSPANFATVTRPITFQWQAVSGATKYNLEVDDNSDFSSPEVDIETTNTSYTVAVGILAPSRTYYWHVRAYK